jgi:hypothetical protein
MAIAEPGAEVLYMKSHYFSHKVGRILAALLFLVSIGLVSSTAVQAQWWPQNRDRDYRRDRDRDYRRDRDRDRDDDDRYRRNRTQNDDRYRRNGQYGNVYQIASNQGYQDGVNTGQRDAQRGQNYNPQRSHFYRNGHGDYGDYGNNGRNNRYEYQQAYRDGFLRGYDEGFRRYGGNSRNRRNGNNSRWPFPW